MLAGPGLTFASPANYSTGGTISFDLELVDLNGDGFLDIATSLQYSAAVAVLLGDGTGRFSPAQLVGFADGVQGFAVADVDNDGDSDLTVANGLSSLAVARNTSAGAAVTFAAPITVPLSSPALGLSSADVNGDGVPDVVASHWSSNVVSVMVGSPLGTFSIAGPFAAGANPYRSAVADVDEDGSADIVVVNDRAYPAVGGVSVLLNASAPVDTDGDGIPDDGDNCVSVANPTQTDTDGDHIGDTCDTDLDGDGVTNTTDNCTSVPNPTQTDTDGDHIGDTCDTDLDGDGVTNTTDNCVSVANPTQTDTDGDHIGDTCDTDLEATATASPTPPTTARLCPTRRKPTPTATTSATPATPTSTATASRTPPTTARLCPTPHKPTPTATTSATPATPTSTATRVANPTNRHRQGRARRCLRPIHLRRLPPPDRQPTHGQCRQPGQDLPSQVPGSRRHGKCCRKPECRDLDQVRVVRLLLERSPRCHRDNSDRLDRPALRGRRVHLQLEDAVDAGLLSPDRDAGRWKIAHRDLLDEELRSVRSSEKAREQSFPGLLRDGQSITENGGR